MASIASVPVDRCDAPAREGFLPHEALLLLRATNRPKYLKGACASRPDSESASRAHYPDITRMRGVRNANSRRLSKASDRHGLRSVSHASCVGRERPESLRWRRPRSSADWANDDTRVRDPEMLTTPRMGAPRPRSGSAQGLPQERA